MSTRLTVNLALFRAARRQREEGAVMFIVAMTLAVLASLGLYALASASNEMKTSGFERQNTQTHYLSEYGVLGGADDMNPTTAQLYLGLMMDPARRDTNCISLPGVDPADPTIPNTVKACRRMGSQELNQPWLSVSQGAVPPGEFGTTALKGDFFIELTDPAQTQPPPGYDMKLGLCFAQFTLTSVGLTQSATGTTGQQIYGSEGVEMARAHITSGPIRCTQ
ncbi:MAG: hypothetical protein ACRELY_26090 [Polyangiaceae bacterium]